MKLSHLLPALFATLVVGCQPTEPKTATNPTTGTKTPGPAVETPTKDNGSVPTPAASADQIPAELKNAAFDYYGLASEQPMDMEVRTTADAGVRTGAQITRFKEMKDGKAIYSVERTGSLTDLLGQMDVSLEPDGIYVNSSSVAKVGQRDLEMPAKLDAGTTWQARTVVEQPGRELNVNVEFKVDGEQDITTPKGPRKALLVTSKGDGTMQGKKVRMDSKSWYVRGVGMVKTELTFTPEGGAASTITIQEAK